MSDNFETLCINKLRFIDLFYFSNVSEELDDLRRCLADTNEELIETKKRSNSRNSRTSIMLKQASVSWEVHLIAIHFPEWKKNKKTRAELGKTFLKYHGKKAFIVKMGEFCSVVPRRIFVPLSRYGRPNIEPKFSYKFYTKILDRSIRCILSQCRYSKF